MRVYNDNSSKDTNLLTEVSGRFGSKFKHVLPSNISSINNQLLITFTTDEWSQTYNNLGIRLKIHVDPLMSANLSADACSITNPCLEKQGHCQSDDECKDYLKCGHNNCPAELGYHPQARCCYDYCSQWLDMDNGVLTSAHYPDYYPGSLRCRTLITVGMTVAGPRTITLEFLHFKVCLYIDN